MPANSAVFGDAGTDPGDATAEIMREVHPRYQATYHEWKRLIDLSEGLNLAHYIKRHPRESADALVARRSRVFYRNFPGPILDLICSYLFSKTITREPGQGSSKSTVQMKRAPFSGGTNADYEMADQQSGASAVPPAEIANEWTQFLYDVDRQGNSIDRFMRRVVYWTQCFGMVDVIVDMPRLARPLANRAEEQQLRVQPYFTYYFPTARTNYEIDEFGRLVWVRYQEPLVGNAPPFKLRDRRDLQEALRMTQAQPTPFVLPALKGAGGQAIPRPINAVYRTFTRTNWYVHTIEENRVTNLEQGEHPCAMVPSVTFFNRQRALTPEIGLSAINDIAGVSETILNYDSLIDESVYQQILNILVMKRQMAHKGDFVIGAENVLEYTGDQPPNYITPSTAPLAFMSQRIVDLKQEIVRLANFNSGDALQVRSVPSGTAATVEFNETDRILAEKAEEAQEGEWKLHALWYRWKGSQFDGTIDYPDSFQVQSFADQVSELAQAGSGVRSDMFRRELEKRLVRRLLPNVPQELLDEIEQEIDTIPATASAPPVWYDPITQEVHNPADPNAPAIGVLGEILGQVQPEQPPPDAGGTVPAPGPVAGARRGLVKKALAEKRSTKPPQTA